MRTNFIIYLLFFVTFSTSAKERFNDNLQQFRLTTEQGLADNTIDCILQDSDGLYYFATSKGISIYNGTSFLNYNISNVEDFSNVLTTLHIIDKHHILIGSRDNGLFLFDKLNDVIRPVSFRYTQLTHITDIEITEDETLWISTMNGDIFYVPSYRSILLDKPVVLHRVSSAFESISSMCRYKEGLLVASFDKQLVYVERSDNSILVEKHNIDVEKRNYSTLCLIDEDELWMGANSVITIMRHKGDGWYKFRDIALPQYDARFIVQSNEVVYVGLMGGGLFEIDKISYKYQLIDQVDTKNLISAAIDRRGEIWLGTWNEGVGNIVTSNPIYREFTLSQTNKNSILYNIIPKNSNEYYLYTLGGDSYEYSFKDKELRSSSFDTIEKLNINGDISNRALFIMNKNRDIELFNSQNSRYEKLDIPNLKNKRIFVIERLSEDKIFIGTQLLGAYIYDQNTKESVSVEFPGDISNNNIRSLIKDEKHDCYWLAIFDEGVFKLKFDKEFNVESCDPVIYDNIKVFQIESMKQIDGKLFVYGSNGLAKIDTDSDKPIMVREQPFNGIAIRGIARYLKDSYWLTSQDGLIYYDANRESVSRFFTDQSFYGLSVVDSTQILVGGVNRLIVGDPREMLLKAGRSRAVISSVSVNGKLIKPSYDQKHNYLTKAIAFADTLMLPTQQQTVTFSLSSQRSSSIVQDDCYYMMDGVDEYWNSIGSSGAIVSYSQLPEGDYNFVLRVGSPSNKNGERVLYIHKDTYWLKIWWIDVMMFMVITFVVVSLSVYYSKMKYKRKLAKSEIDKQEELQRQHMLFFTNMSHDLKTPLTLMLTPLNDMLNHPQMPEVFKERIESMCLNGVLLNSKVNKILNYRQADFSEVNLIFEPFTIRQMMYEIVTPFKEYAEHQGVLFNLRSQGLEDRPYTIHTDRAKIESILENIISNAIKYTKEGAKVDILYGVVEDNFVVEVSDSGIGIDSQQIAHIFDRYYRINNDIKGTGIGLFIVSQYVKLLEGFIDVTSQIGVGTKFKVTLPLYPECAKNAIAEIANEMLEDDDNDGVATIMVVDDNKEMRDYLVEIFKPSYRVLTAASAKDALEQIKEEVPDLIITDLMMPEIDGLTLCKMFKRDRITSHIPIIILSAFDTPETRLDCWHAGAESFESKPFNSKLLFAKVATILKTRRSLKYRYQLQNSNRVGAEVDDANNSEQNLDDKFMQDVNEAIERCCDIPDLSVEDLAKTLSMRKDQLYRKLKALTGMSINQYIRTYRLGRASALLRSRKYTVSEVLYRVGFNNPSYFTKCFKKEYGVLPSEYLIHLDQQQSDDADFENI